MAVARRIHATVSGRVQGVFFRGATEKEARRLGVRGWVRNVPDGTVEVLAEGDEPTLLRLVEWLHHGPPGARVTRVDVTWSDSDGTLDAFHIDR